MAFLCPVRIRRGKKKKPTGADVDKELMKNNSGSTPGMGRITGSASIETLVRVGIEKEHGLSPDSKMVVLHDFTPCVDDELEVKRGQIVNILYRENDWVYVIGLDTRQEGFIPHSYCTPYNSHLAELAIKKKLPRDNGSSGNTLQTESNHDCDLTSGEISDCDSIGKKPPPLPGNPLNNNNNNNPSVTTSPNNQTTPTATIIPNSPLSPHNNNHNTNNPHHNNNINNNTISHPQQQQLHNSHHILNNHLSHSNNLSSDEPDMLPFAKDPSGRYIVLYTFIARDENDVSVERGEFVTVLNREDPDWYWIVRSDGQEGFIPSGFVYPADNVMQGHLNTTASQIGNGANTPFSTGTPGGGTNGTTTGDGDNGGNNTTSGGHHHHPHLNQNADDLRFHGTELVMLYDYKAQAPDDLSVRRGDWIYADLSNQTVDGWLWAYAPKTRKYGFIPKAYARPPAMTSL